MDSNFSEIKITLTIMLTKYVFAPLNLWSHRERRICGNVEAGNENFYNFVKISTTERGAGDPWDTGAGAESWALLWAGLLPKLSDARDAHNSLGYYLSEGNDAGAWCGG